MNPPIVVHTTKGRSHKQPTRSIHSTVPPATLTASSSREIFQCQLAADTGVSGCVALPCNTDCSVLVADGW